MEKCNSCPHNRLGYCTKLAYVNTYEVEKCILDNDYVKQLTDGSLKKFVFANSPITILQRIGYRKKTELPRINEKVITLIPGFGSVNVGNVLTVIRKGTDTIIAKDKLNCEYTISKFEWYKKIYVMEKE